MGLTRRSLRPDFDVAAGARRRYPDDLSTVKTAILDPYQWRRARLRPF
jgi:hypothetical protein